jgi:WD40 repeat protein
LVTVWDTSEWQERTSLTCDPVPRGWALFSPRGELLTCEGGQIQFRDPLTREPTARLGEKDGPQVTCVAFTRTGRLAAVGDQARRIHLQEAPPEAGSDRPSTWRMKDHLGEHLDRVTALAFSPDDRTLASASHDRTVKLWCVRAAAEVASLEAHRGRIDCLAFSPDGTTLASGGETSQWQGEVYLWRAPRE